MSRWVRLAMILIAIAASVTVLVLEKPILGLDLRGGVQLLMEADLSSASSASERETFMGQALETIRFRINESGLTERSVTRAGENRIWVEIPCPAPPETCEQPREIRDLIERRGFLEFRKVLRELANPSLESPSLLEEILYGKAGEAYLVTREPIITGADLENAQAGAGGLQQGGSFYVSLTFREAGAKKFADQMINGTLQGRDKLAIVLDGVVQSAPEIEPGLITSTKTQGWRSVQSGTQITGLDTLEESKNLAIILKSGNLPVPIKIQYEEAIGPSLGKDSIDKGMFAFILAVTLVFLFMIVYYKFSGIIADLTMVLNLMMLVAAMVLLDATWTLPGIAGLILTIGMGLDSNVLIFERIREELRSGKTPRAAIDYGYERALLTVIDSHVTTLITALILFTFGTGAIKGFATTLSIGIFINLFAALVGTRFAFDLIKEREPRRLSI